MKPITNPAPDTPLPTLKQLARALQSPIRWRTLGALAREHALPVVELARRFGVTQPGMAKHMRILRECSLVTIRYGRLYYLAASVRVDMEARQLDLGGCILRLDAMK